MYCSICNISCPSNYQYQQHLNGKKHKQKVSGGKKSTSNSGICFYWQKGTCWKGDACTYRHENPDLEEYELDDIDAIPVPSWVKTMDYGSDSNDNAVTKRKSLLEAKSGGGGLVAEVMLCKGEQEASSPSAEKENGLAPLFCKPVAASNKKKEAPMSFPEEFRNALKRKRDVNLYIMNEQVVFEFHYNATVIRAIKEHIKGRAWNPNQKCWTCPLESLPNAIALYEFMGRTVDDSLKKRAKEIETSYGGLSASDAIKLAIELDLDKTDEDDDDDCSNIGSVLVTFLYDADVVSAVKMLSPAQRSYHPETKAWTVDLLALSELLDHLEPLGYHPSAELQEVAEACSKLENLLWNQEAGSESQPIDIDADEGEKPSPVQNDKDHAQLLEDGLKQLVSSVEGLKKSDGGRKLDRSDCGQAKRRRLTKSQKLWSATKRGVYDSDDDFEDEFGYDTFFGGDTFSSFTKRHLLRPMSKSNNVSPAIDCDCGQPWKRLGGKHVCRYFGTFHCGCGNQWTSAYCWKGEKQACRGCNRESLPVRKDQLDGRPSNRTGAHDSARCAMCKRLGYDCSL